MKKCSIYGCEKKVKSKGYCEMHYYRYRRHGSPYIRKKGGGKPKVIKHVVDVNGCHICISHKPGTWGYPTIHRNGKTQNIHRFIYEQVHGKVPDHLVVRHKCDVRNCINTNHMELGTHKENSQDMVVRGRNLYGEINRNSKLTEKEVLEIRRLSVSYSQRELAKMFNVGKTTIARIQNRETWKHI